MTALARAFHDDVLFNFLAPHLVRQARGLLTLMLAGLADALPFHEVWVARSPGSQRGGAGTTLLTPVLERCDDEGVSAYLETQRHENVPWYRRRGFEVVEKLTVAICPPIWTLLREPR